MSFQSLYTSQPCICYIFLTGKPGIGKTTLVKKVCEILLQKNVSLRGFYTEEIRHQNCRVGFDVVTFQGNRGSLARTHPEDGMKGPRVGKYLVNLKSFEDVVMPIVCSPPSNDSVLVIDEIGRMEMLSKKFCKQVESIFDIPQTVLATVPVAPNAFIKRLQSLPLSETIEVNYSNRDTLLEPITELVSRSLLFQKQ